MESLSAEDVKRIAGFLNFKDMVNFSQTRQPFQADLKPLIRKAEVAMMKGDGGLDKLKKVVATLTRALIHIHYVAFDDDLDDDGCRDWVKEMVGTVDGAFHLDARLKTQANIEPFHPGMNFWRVRDFVSLAWFEGSAEDDKVIVQHFLNEMD